MGEIGKLDLCLERIGGLNLGTLVDRKLLQKKIYFLQEFGVKLGYSYGFYIYGPYSSDLTSDAFFLMQLKNQAPKTLEAAELSASEEGAITRAIAFFSEIKGTTAEIAYKLELGSSLHFLWHVSYFQNKTKQETFRRLKKKKNITNDDFLEQAWKDLETYGLMKS